MNRSGGLDDCMRLRREVAALREAAMFDLDPGPARELAVRKVSDAEVLLDYLERALRMARAVTYCDGAPATAGEAKYSG